MSALLSLHAGLLGWGAWRHSPTVDEPMHLAAGLYHWQTGRFDLDRGNPPLTGLVSAIPILAADPRTDWSSVPASYTVAVDFLEANGLRTCWLVTLGSWACIPFSILGGYICCRWATDLYGDASGLTALALWCFSPNTIAYGQLITGDMPATAMGVAAAYFFWRWLCRPQFSRAIPAGLLLGMAELAKFVWVILYVLWPILWLIWFLASRRRIGHAPIIPQLLQLAVIFLLGLYVINLAYAFDGTFGKLGRYHVGQVALELCSPDSDERTFWADEAMAGLPVPLPEDYVVGIDEIVRLSARPIHTFLRRERQEGGYWYYYIYAILVKLPLGMLFLGAVAAILTVFPWRSGTDWRSEFTLLATSLAVLGFVSMSDMLQTFRYVMPFLPYVIVWISKTARVLVEGHSSQARFVSALFIWSIFSGLNTCPHSLGYFNELAGGPAKGSAHLIGADADWGQDFLYLRRWLTQHPEASPLGMTWRHPLLDPRFLGIDYIDVPSGVVATQSYSFPRLYEAGPQPGWYAINVNALRGRAGSYAYFHRFEPIGHAGYSISIYHITMTDANRVRKELGLPELPTIRTD